MQVRVVTGRDASLSDLLANSLGGIIGVELALRRQGLFRPRGQAAFALTVAAAALFGVVTSLTSLGLRPSSVPCSLWIQWTPDRAPLVPFTGQLLDFRLDSINLPRQFYPPTSLGVDRLLRRQAWQATATITTANLPADPLHHRADRRGVHGPRLDRTVRVEPRLPAEDAVGRLPLSVAEDLAAGCALHPRRRRHHSGCGSRAPAPARSW